MRQNLKSKRRARARRLTLAILAAGMICSANSQSGVRLPGAQTRTSASLPGTVTASTAPRGQYDLKESGARGDGSVDTAAIQEAFATAQAKGKILHIPDGDFQTASAITIHTPNFIVQCDGVKSHLYTAGGTALFHIAASGVRISGCNLENKNPQAPGNNVVVDFSGDGGADVAIRNNYISGGEGVYTSTGVNLTGTHMKRIDISGNTFAHLWAGIRGVPVAGDADPQEVNISGNEMYDISGDGVTLNYPIRVICCGHSQPVPRHTAGQNFIVSNNVIEVLSSGSKDGFAVAVAGADGVLIANNQLRSRLEGVHIEDNASNVSVMNNEIFGTMTNPCIKIYGSDHFSVIGNQLSNCAAEGIFVNEGSQNGGYSSQFFDISHNMVNGCGTAGIRLATGYRGPAYGRVSENTVTGCVDGFLFQDHLDQTEFDGNTATGNSGYGLNLDKLKGTFRIGNDNLFTGNTLGEINYPTASSDVSLQSYHTTATAQTPGGRHATVYGTTGMYLGNYAEGTLQVRVVNRNSSDFLDYTYHISWNGTTLTATEGARAYAGSGPLDRAIPLVSKGFLQVGAYSALSDQSSQPDILTFTVDFTGVLSAGGRVPVIHPTTRIIPTQ